MKIQELENELNISRANIRFYEKEGLLNPARKENGYRDYSDDDIAVLKKIIIYRKLGISVTDIKKIFANELELQEAVSQSIDNLQKEIERLNGSIKLCREIQSDKTDNNSFDEEHYWEEISNNEAEGSKFVDIYKDYIEFEKDLFNRILKQFFPVLEYPKNNKKGLFLFLCGILIFSIIRGITGVIIWKYSFFHGFLEPFIIFVVISIFAFPLFLIKDKHPKLVSIILTIIFLAIVLVFIGIALLILYGIINTVFNL